MLSAQSFSAIAYKWYDDVYVIFVIGNEICVYLYFFSSYSLCRVNVIGSSQDVQLIIYIEMITYVLF